MIKACNGSIPLKTAFKVQNTDTPCWRTKFELTAFDFFTRLDAKTTKRLVLPNSFFLLEDGFRLSSFCQANGVGRIRFSVKLWGIALKQFWFHPIFNFRANDYYYVTHSTHTSKGLFTTHLGVLASRAFNFHFKFLHFSNSLSPWEKQREYQSCQKIKKKKLKKNNKQMNLSECQELNLHRLCIFFLLKPESWCFSADQINWFSFNFTLFVCLSATQASAAAQTGTEKLISNLS